MLSNIELFYLFGGICFLLYGVKQAGDGLQYIAGAKLRHILISITDHKLRAIAVGAIVTALLQSSTATTVVLISLVSSGLLNLPQSIGIILGADIGSTVTVQLLAFNVADYAILFIGIGISIMLGVKRKSIQAVGRTIFGFGLIFYAIKIMSAAIIPLGSSDIFKNILIALSESPLLLLILSAGFTALVHSSAATIAIAIALAFSQQHLMTMSLALPIIYGANIGTSATALLASVGNTVEAKRVALAHALFKLFGVAIFYPISSPFILLVQATASDTARQIANAHTLFNVAIAFVFLPLSVPLSKLVTIIIPEYKEKETEVKPKYLDEKMLDTPSLAFGLATRETLRMAEIVSEMFIATRAAFHAKNEEEIEILQRKDDILDIFDREIKRYLTKLSQHHLNQEQSHRSVILLTIINNLEDIGDIIDKNLLELAKKKVRKQLEFSQQGWNEIQELHQRVLNNLEQVIAAFTTNDKMLAKQIVENKPDFAELERQFRQSHIARLQAGLPESLETSEIHLDVLTNLKRINSHVVAIALAIVE
ncbi:MAG: Na/Pi cotransporter family protein [bacterium]|nr:Na/Pi cotransporter family protein [bacterium]